MPGMNRLGCISGHRHNRPEKDFPTSLTLSLDVCFLRLRGLHELFCVDFCRPAGGNRLRVRFRSRAANMSARLPPEMSGGASRGGQVVRSSRR